jgi:hypothetical protein
MTIINLTNVAPPSLSGLAVYATLGGANLEWVIPELDRDVWSTEIWFATTNDRSLATLVTEVKSANTYFWQDTTGSTGYFWIRSKNLFGYTNGDWEPTGLTSGVALIVPGISGADITPTATVSSASFSTSSSFFNITISNWNTWYEKGNIQFTVPSSGHGIVTGYIMMCVSNSAITSGGTEQINCLIRFRLYDVTGGTDVPGETSYEYLLSAFGNTIFGQTNIVTHNIKYTFGALGVLIPGHTYKIYAEISKNRTGSGATMTTSVDSYSYAIDGNNIS